jgi:hypothetical protein
MHGHYERKHVIDFLFPIALLFVFAASSFVVILLAANIYSHTTASSEEHYETRTPLSYTAEKIRQADDGGQISIGTFDGQESLIIKQQYGQQDYETYIYAYEGKLMELFIQSGVNAAASSGTEIMKVNDFKMAEISDGLFCFSCTSGTGRTIQSYIASASKGGGSDEF